MSDISIRSISNRRERRAFLLFPWRIYRDEPNWVPPVLSERAGRLDPSLNPFFDEDGDAEFYVAWRGRRPVGTIGVAIDRQSNEYNGESVAVWGFFECVNDQSVAVALLDQAAAWARERSMSILRGPQSFGGSDEPGLLIEGRQTAPAVLQGWTADYYRGFVEGYGFYKYRDALAYRAIINEYRDEQGQVQIPPKVVRVAEYVQKRYGYRVRPGNLDDWDSELATALRIYNLALGTLPEFVPMSAEEWQRQADLLRPMLDPELVGFAEVDGEVVGFALGLPDANCVLRHCNGLRYPWDYAKAWWYGRRIPGASFKIMAMLPEYWGRGLDALLYLHVARGAIKRGFEWMDMSLTGDDNPMTNKLAQAMGVPLDKRYRVYQMEL